MKQQPILKTDRLILRPFSFNDAPIVQKLAGDYNVAKTTLNIPHPYADGEAEKWIATHVPLFNIGKIVTFAIILSETNQLTGAISLILAPEHDRAEMGYWIGKSYWGKGYCTEAARRLIKYGFEELKLNRIFAHFMTGNPASGRVMEKAGMIYEGHLRQHVKKWDVVQDLKIYAILKDEYFKGDGT